MVKVERAFNSKLKAVRKNQMGRKRRAAAKRRNRRERAVLPTTFRTSVNRRNQ
jgi:hypothetical protein